MLYSIHYMELMFHIIEIPRVYRSFTVWPAGTALFIPISGFFTVFHKR